MGKQALLGRRTLVSSPALQLSSILQAVVFVIYTTRHFGFGKNSYFIKQLLIQVL
jgi:hypothetical protein